MQGAPGLICPGPGARKGGPKAQVSCLQLTHLDCPLSCLVVSSVFSFFVMVGMQGRFYVRNFGSLGLFQPSLGASIGDLVRKVLSVHGYPQDV